MIHFSDCGRLGDAKTADAQAPQLEGILAALERQRSLAAADPENEAALPELHGHAAGGLVAGFDLGRFGSLERRGAQK